MLETPRPVGVRLELSTACQLRCPSCPTTQGLIKKHLGTQMLPLQRFKAFVKENPSVRWIEISNWGEAFLHPDIVDVLSFAYEHDVGITCGNGSNMNAMSDRVVEAIVRYQVLGLTCSIDGVTQATYEMYRRKGSLERALAAVDDILHLKAELKSELPQLTWQFVMFDHNAAEFEQARAMAEARGMRFFPKVSWDPAVASQIEGQLTAADSTDWDSSQCSMLWVIPQINPDGRLLGCCANYWGDFGNVFEQGFEAVYQGPKLTYARDMLRGKVPARADIPCTTCEVYQRQSSRGQHMSEQQLDGWYGFARGIEHRLALRDEFKRRHGHEPLRARVKRRVPLASAPSAVETACAHGGDAVAGDAGTES